MSKNKIKLSVCMIVKNEEKNLSRCLQSFMGISGWCDQLVIVDTGSEDSTVDIAKSYGAEVHTLILQEWDFSKARNHSLSFAKGDWILVIDADEEMVGEVQEFRKLKRELAGIKSLHAVSLRLIDIIKGQNPMNVNTLKIFRRGKVHFEDIVHNRPVVEGGNRTLVYAGNLHIKHYGYDLNPEDMKAKYARTVGLLKKRLEADPEDLTAYFYLAQIYGFYNDEDNCLKCSRLYIESVKRLKWKREDINNSIYSVLINMLIKKGALEEALQYILEAMTLMPKDLDIAYAQISYGIKADDHFQIITGIYRFIQNYERYNTEENIAERGSRFVYSYTNHHIGMVLYYASHFFLTYGMNCLNSFDQILTQTTSLTEQEKALKESLLNIGIDWTRKHQTKEN